MKRYENTNTGEIFTEDEVLELYGFFGWETRLDEMGIESGEEYIEHFVKTGELKEV